MTPPTWPVAPTTATCMDTEPTGGPAGGFGGFRSRELLPLGQWAGVLRAAVEAEGGVQAPHRPLHVRTSHHAGDPDRGRRDHLDVDAVGGQRLEHGRGDAGTG